MVLISASSPNALGMFGVECQWHIAMMQADSDPGERDYMSSVQEEPYGSISTQRNFPKTRNPRVVNTCFKS
eukprot:3495288-Amphidinium_carterae.1